MVRFDICWAGVLGLMAVAIIGWVRGRVGLGSGVVWGPTVPEVVKLVIIGIGVGEVS